MTDSKFICNIFLFLSVTVFMARLSICVVNLVFHKKYNLMVVFNALSDLLRNALKALAGKCVF
jgi:hypothetical protein